MTYPGGKDGAGVYQTIINQIPPHAVFIEAFAGAAAITRRKRPAARTILIDIDPAAPARAMVPESFRIGDAIKFLATYPWRGTEFVFCDPPYVRSARRSPAPLYRFELTDADHRRLLAVVDLIPSPVMVCGYANDLYAARLGHWRTVTYQAATRRGMATETLWMNYPEPVALHDPQYLGRDYRERERIKKKARRWADNFRALPTLERQAVLSRILSPDVALWDLTDENGEGSRILSPHVAILPAAPSDAAAPARRHVEDYGKNQLDLEDAVAAARRA